MQAFIVRPFNTKEGIDFDAVHEKLIEPALKAADINGGTTGLILEAGNIREDMFQLLLLADIVIADISIHNANVFYELGIRHALRPRQTYLIRAKVTKPREQRGPQDDVPFDIATDRYLTYDHTKPEESVAELVMGLNQTKTGDRVDSPVFRSLPRLEEPDHSLLSPVPPEFADEVELAASRRQSGKLGLLAREAGWFLWQTAGLCLTGRKQFHLGLWIPARNTWEQFRDVYPNHPEANLLLGTVYQRLRELTLSDQRVQRVLDHPALDRKDKAEALALLARNEKTRGCERWDKKDVAGRRKTTLKAGLFKSAAELYEQAYEQDLNHYYSGLNALSLYALLLGLIAADRPTWSGMFETDEMALEQEKKIQTNHDRLAAAVGMSLKSESERLKKGVKDLWLGISQADYKFLTASRDSAVAAGYEAALAGAEPFHIASARAQIELFRDLDLRQSRVEACLDSFPAAAAPDVPLAQTIVFTGHMIDAPGREKPRFPPGQEGNARKAIHAAVSDLLNATPGLALGIAGGANGGDILFHEVCAELGVPTRVLLTLPEGPFIAASVAHGGPAWIKRFNALIKERPTQILAETKQLPRWMRERPGYDVWQRTNLWLLEEALATGTPAQTLVALWDGESGDGPGGTRHLVELARERGLNTQILSTSVIFPNLPQ